MKVLIADDDELALELLRHTLEEAGYEVVVATDGREALEVLETERCRLVISDWEMPSMTGVELCRRLRSRRSASYVYFILVTARHDQQDVVVGLDAGADDFLTKPFEPSELCVRMRAGERMLALSSRDVTIFSLAKLAESRDSDTGAHLERVRAYCRVIAERLGTYPAFQHEVDQEFIDLLFLTSPLHDIGKVGIPDSVLLKPGRLDESEFEQIKRHTVIGAETLEAASKEYPEAEFLRVARDIALTHHERWDGGGYPQGLVAEQIPLCGRIVALADVYDALTAKRVYKEAMPHAEARGLILEESGRHFDPAIVQAFLESEDDFQSIRRTFNDGAARQEHASRAAEQAPKKAEAAT